MATAVVSSATVVYNQATRAGKSGSADAWFDGPLSWSGKAGSDWTTWASDGQNNTIKGVGPLSDPAAAATAISMTTGQPAGISYIAGGPVVLVTGSTLAMVQHFERWAGGNPSFFYSSIGIAKSIDNGASWTCLGEMLQMKYAFDNGQTSAQDVDGGCLVPSLDGLYYYCYYREWPNISTSYMSVARCLISDFNTAILAGSVPTFNKWQGATTFNTGTTGSDIGCDLRFMFPVWDPDLRSYLAVGATPALTNPSAFKYSTSGNGLAWEPFQTVEPTGSSGTYCGLFPTTITGVNSGRGPWTCLYLQGTRWTDAAVQSRTLDFSLEIDRRARQIVRGGQR